VADDRTLEDLRDVIRAFAYARDWEQFHTPKNLTMAMIVEAAELVEHFQWLTPAESARLGPEAIEEVCQEIGDVLIYLTRLADVLGIDPLQAAFDKVKSNERRYPVEKARGNNKKYDELG
jgi:dCTP diphosphatase